MYTLPEAAADVVEKWQGAEMQEFPDFTVVWCGEPSVKILNRNSIKPKNVFVLKHRQTFKWVYMDKKGVAEIPYKWYAKCFQKLDFKPSQNVATLKIQNAYIDIPLYPTSYYAKLQTSKKRKRFSEIQSDILFPTWKHVTKHKETIDVAEGFGELFSRADANEIELSDPFSGYSSVAEIKRNKTGNMVYMAIAGFVYHHCRENLGYPTNR